MKLPGGGDGRTGLWRPLVAVAVPWKWHFLSAAVASASTYFSNSAQRLRIEAESFATLL